MSRRRHPGARAGSAGCGPVLAAPLPADCSLYIGLLTSSGAPAGTGYLSTTNNARPRLRTLSAHYRRVRMAVTPLGLQETPPSVDLSPGRARVKRRITPLCASEARHSASCRVPLLRPLVQHPRAPLLALLFREFRCCWISIPLPCEWERLPRPPASGISPKAAWPRPSGRLNPSCVGGGQTGTIVPYRAAPWVTASMLRFAVGDFHLARAVPDTVRKPVLTTIMWASVGSASRDRALIGIGRRSALDSASSFPQHKACGRDQLGEALRTVAADWRL
jgi:hypothetical protein